MFGDETGLVELPFDENLDFQTESSVGVKYKVK